MYRKVTLIALVAIYPVLLSACNTVKGVGEDVKIGGEVLSNTATKVKNKM